MPLVERLTVSETGWLTERDFATGIGLAYATPGPVLILASYVGYHVAGLPGAAAATAAVFATPVLLAAFAARLVQRLSGSARFHTFGRFAAAAAVGLLGVTLLDLAIPLFRSGPIPLAGSLAIVLAERKGISPAVLLAIAALAGCILGGMGR